MSPFSASALTKAGSFFLPRVEARVFKHENAARGQRVDGLFRFSSDAIGGEGDLVSDNLAERHGDRGKGVFGIGRGLGAAEMREHDHFRALAGEFGQRAGDAREPRRVRDLAVGGRNVEVGANEHALAPDVAGFEKIVECLVPGHCRNRSRN